MDEAEVDEAEVDEAEVDEAEIVAWRNSIRRTDPQLQRLYL